MNQNPDSDNEKYIRTKKDLDTRKEYLNESIKNIEGEMEKAKFEEEYLMKLQEGIEKQIDSNIRNKIYVVLE